MLWNRCVMPECAQSYDIIGSRCPSRSDLVIVLHTNSSTRTSIYRTSLPAAQQPERGSWCGQHWRPQVAAVTQAFASDSQEENVAMTWANNI